MAKEAKKEAFRKYLESSGVLDALTKVLVALYEENEKPSAAIEDENLKMCDRFIQRSLCGPTLPEYEKLQAEKTDLQLKYDDLLAKHQDTFREKFVDSRKNDDSFMTDYRPNINPPSRREKSLEELRNSLPISACKKETDNGTEA